jgi:hypothetical protein
MRRSFERVAYLARISIISATIGALVLLLIHYGHKQVAHHRSGSRRCAAHSLVFAAGLDSYCAHGNPAASHSA